MINLSKWLNSRARKQNLDEIKAALWELMHDLQFQEQFQQLDFRNQLGLARDLVNLQRGKYQEWRMWGLVFAGVATALWKAVEWWLGR